VTVEHFLGKSLGQKYAYGTTIASVQINRKDRITFYYFTQLHYVDDIVKTTTEPDCQIIAAVLRIKKIK
jgi:hypothetical protein